MSIPAVILVVGCVVAFMKWGFKGAIVFAVVAFLALLAVGKLLAVLFAAAAQAGL